MAQQTKVHNGARQIRRGPGGEDLGTDPVYGEVPAIRTINRVVSVAGTLAATQITVTRNATNNANENGDTESRLFVISDPVYMVAVRFRKSGDTAPMTTTTGATPWHFLIPPSSGVQTLLWPADAVDALIGTYSTAPTLAVWSV